MALVGYLRVSTVEQNTARQLDGMGLDKVFTDHASGRDTNRPELARCLEFLREGDTLFVHSMDRLARNLGDLRAIVERLTSRGVVVSFHKEALTFTGKDSPMSNLLMSVMGAVAQFERELLRERQKEGIAIAKANRVYKGRIPVLTPEQAVAMRAKIALGVPKAQVAREFGISRSSMYNYAEAPDA